jgi:hypothetical protein
MHIRRQGRLRRTGKQGRARDASENKVGRQDREAKQALRGR